VKTLTLWVLLSGMLVGAAVAEQKTLIGDLGEVEHGGFGGPVVRLTSINGEFGVLTGGRGGWIVNHRFVLGGGGYGLASTIKAAEVGAPTAGGTDKLEMGYGGPIVEYIIASDRLLHLSVEALVGGGGLTTTEGGSSDEFFVAEAGINAMVNVTEFFRMGAGGSYRYIAGADFYDLNSSDLSGGSIVLTFKFGSF
jgi:hypothetical protein